MSKMEIAKPSRYRYSLILLKQLVKTDFKLRYQGSFLGYLWSLLKPLALFGILYLVFSVFLGIGKRIDHFPVYLLLGVVLWTYFVEVTSTSVASIVERGDLLRKINFPRYVIVLAGSFSAFINLCINMVVVAGFVYFNNIEISVSVLLLPFIIVQLFIVSLGLSFFLSAAYVKLRDINYIWEVLMTGAFYATPILYDINDVAESSPTIAKAMLLNPVAQIIQDARYVLVTDKTVTIDQLWGGHTIRIVPIGLTIICAVLAAAYFRAKSKSFAEEL